MARKHVFILVVILGAAALSGLVAMARTTGVGAPAKAAPAAASPALDARLRQLTRFEKRLKKELAKKPAKHAAAPRHAAVATSSSAGQSGTSTFPQRRPRSSPRTRPSPTTTSTRSTRTKAAMTNHIARLYAAAGAILALFLAWAGIAAHPWQSDQTTPVNTRADSQARALAAYEKRLQKDARLVRKVVRRRAAEARAARQAAARLRLPPPRAAPRLRAGLPPRPFAS